MVLKTQGFFVWQTPAAGSLYSRQRRPHPLARDEEEAADRAENGDQQARDTLIEHNLRLVVYIAKRYETNRSSWRI